MPWLRQSTETTENFGPFLSNDTGTLNITNLVITPDLVLVGKNGGTMLGKANLGTGVHNANAHYQIAIGSADSDTLGRLSASINIGTSLPVWKDFDVIPASVYDALMGTNNLPTGTAENVLSIPAITSGTIGLAIQVNSGTIGAVGTVEKLIANGDKTGYAVASGTVGLAVEVTTLPAIPLVGTVGNLLANQAKTGYSLAADQSAVTIGSVNAIPAITGGTIDLAVKVNSGTLDLVTNAGTLLQTLSRAEPGQGVPPATTDSFTKEDYIYKWSRNKKTNNGTNFDIYADDASTVDQRASVSSDGTTATIGELASGA